MRIAVAGAAAVLLLGLSSGCSRDAEPAFLRLRGAAPALEVAPDTPALLVVFWASWCKPCVEETAGLLELVEDLPERLGVVVLSHDDDIRAAHEHFGSAPRPRFQLRLDQGKETAHAFGVDRLPASFLVVEGRLAARFDGPERWGSAGMRKLLGRLMAPGRETEH